MRNNEGGKFLGRIPVGNKGDPRRPVVEALAERGIFRSREFVSTLRAGVTEAERTRQLDRAIDVLLRNDASGKNTSYKAITETGIRCRKKLLSNPRRYSSEGYTESIAQHFSMPSYLLRRLELLARADMVFSMEMAHSQEERRFAERFQEVAYEFIDAYLGGKPTHTPEPIHQLKKVWGREGSVKHFYELFSQWSTRAQATWRPYEMEPLDEFYTTQQEEKRNTLSPFDLYILTSFIHGQSDIVTASYIKDRTGVVLDQHDPDVHRRVLFGRLQIRQGKKT